MLTLFLTLKPNAEERAEKNKNIFYKCVLEFHFISIFCLGGFILAKKVKIIVPYGILIHTGKGRGGRDELVRRLEWQQFTKLGRKYEHD
jgi:hypothetical protein